MELWRPGPGSGRAAASGHLSAVLAPRRKRDSELTSARTRRWGTPREVVRREPDAPGRRPATCRLSPFRLGLNPKILLRWSTAASAQRFQARVARCGRGASVHRAIAGFVCPAGEKGSALRCGGERGERVATLPQAWPMLYPSSACARASNAVIFTPCVNCGFALPGGAEAVSWRASFRARSVSVVSGRLGASPCRCELAVSRAQGLFPWVAQRRKPRAVEAMTGVLAPARAGPPRLETEASPALPRRQGSRRSIVRG